MSFYLNDGGQEVSIFMFLHTRPFCVKKSESLVKGQTLKVYWWLKGWWKNFMEIFTCLEIYVYISKGDKTWNHFEGCKLRWLPYFFPRKMLFVYSLEGKNPGTSLLSSKKDLFTSGRLGLSPSLRRKGDSWSK